MSRKTVLFRTSSDQPLRSDHFIKTQLPQFRNSLEDAAGQLATTGSIHGHRASRLPDGDWSIWLEDPSQERHNFLLYVSALEEPKTKPGSVQNQKRRELGVWQEHGHAQGSWREFVEAAHYIEGRFSGALGDKLLERLEFASHGKTAFDGTVEFVSDGVILRVLNENQQVREFAAEVHLQWK